MVYFRCAEAIRDEIKVSGLQWQAEVKSKQTCTLLRSCIEIADSGCCCLRVAVSWGGGGAGILLAVLLRVLVLEPFVSPFVLMTAAIGGGKGGGRGGSGHTD